MSLGVLCRSQCPTTLCASSWFEIPAGCSNAYVDSLSMCSCINLHASQDAQAALHALHRQPSTYLHAQQGVFTVSSAISAQA
jgi:hypothetical protein